MSRIISLHRILFFKKFLRGFPSNWEIIHGMEYHWFFFSHSIPQCCLWIQIPEKLTGCLDGSSDWSVGGGWTTGVGGRTLLWEVGPWPGSSPPHSPPPPALQTELHTSNSHILALGFHESPILHPETFSLQLSPVLLHSITSGPKSSSPAYLPGTTGLFSEQQGVLFLLSAPQATPPPLPSSLPFSPRYQHFHFLVNSLSCIVSCFFILNFSFVLSGTFAFKFYPHHGKLLKMGLIMELKSLEMIDWETILRNIGDNSISISSHISMLIL